MSFIVIEGLDGAGKSTQIQHIEDFFSAKGIACKFLHFPRPDAPFYGEMISRFLRGELGEIDRVDPYVVAMLYAGDRADAASTIRQWQDNKYVVITDRYLYSNIAFQCAKINNQEEKNKLAHWIKEFEYGYNKIPVPDLNLFLDVPFAFTQRSLTKRREGEDRDYLQGKQDIHEASLDFQQQVREVYLWQVEENTDFEAITCSDNAGNMLPPEIIFDKIAIKLNQLVS